MKRLPSSSPSSDRRRLLGSLSALGCVTVLPGMAGAQATDDKQMWIIVPYAAGGAIDLVGRAVAAELSRSRGHAVLVENRTGAGGNIGAAHVARAAPDGRTLLVSGGSLTVAKQMFANLSFDPGKDLTPIAQIGTAPSALVVAANSPHKDVKSLIAAAKAQPGKLALGHGGVGTTSEHLPGELFKARADVDMTTVAYKGMTPALTDLIGGQITGCFTNILNVLQHVREGRLRALAIASKERLAALPDVPTMIEAGLPDFEAGVWWGLFGPANMKAADVERLNAELNTALKSGALKERLESMSAQPVTVTPTEFRAMFDEESTRWRQIIQKAGLKPG